MNHGRPILPSTVDKDFHHLRTVYTPLERINPGMSSHRRSRFILEMARQQLFVIWTDKERYLLYVVHPSCRVDGTMNDTKIDATIVRQIGAHARGRLQWCHVNIPTLVSLSQKHSLFTNLTGQLKSEQARLSVGSKRQHVQDPSSRACLWARCCVEKGCMLLG